MERQPAVTTLLPASGGGSLHCCWILPSQPGRGREPASLQIVGQKALTLRRAIPEVWHKRCNFPGAMGGGV